MMRVRIDRQFRFGWERISPGAWTDSLGTVYAWSTRPAYYVQVGYLRLYLGDWGSE